MNFFEQELRKIAELCAEIEKPTFVGRACYGDLGGDNRIKLQFVTNGHADHYDTLKATVLNRLNGKVDCIKFQLEDTWSKKQVSNPSFREGLVPHIWTNNGKSAWYAYKPTDADMKKLAAEIGAYLAVFTDHSLIPEKTQSQTAKKERNHKKPIAEQLEAGKAKAAAHNTSRKTPETPSKTKKETEH